MQPGGQLTTTTEVENFPGFPTGIQGPDLVAEMRKQAEKFGTNIIAETVTSVDFSHRPFSLTLSNGTDVKADTVIIATGATARYLGLADEQKYLGMGVSACATCDGFFYRKKRVAVVGGGDTACEEALYLSGLASKVYLIVRKNYLRASQVMQERLKERENIEVLFNCNTVGLFGEEFLEGAKLVENKGTDQERFFDIAIDGFFLAIGHDPCTKLFRGQLELDDQGYILVKSPSTATSVDGVFAAGDVADPQYQQAINAAGSGCRAALDADRFLGL
jgi:thioredoxin reductase (NADPH)